MYVLHWIKDFPLEAAVEVGIGMTTARRGDALRHLQTLAAYPGYWELRALRRISAP